MEKIKTKRDGSRVAGQQRFLARERDYRSFPRPDSANCLSSEPVQTRGQRVIFIALCWRFYYLFSEIMDAAGND